MRYNSEAVPYLRVSMLLYRQDSDIFLVQCTRLYTRVVYKIYTLVAACHSGTKYLA